MNIISVRLKNIVYPKVLWILCLTLILSTLIMPNSLFASSDSHKPKVPQTDHDIAGGSHPKAADVLPQPIPNLTLRQIPTAPTLLSPKALSRLTENNVILKWSPSPGANQYHVQLATDGNFKWLIAEDFFVTNNEFPVTNLSPGKTYFWRVAAVKTQNAPAHRKSAFSTSTFDVPY